MTTIILTVSRVDYLERVLSCVELIDCNPEYTNLLCVVDGDDSLFLRVRNLILDTKYNEKLTVKLNREGSPARFDIRERRARITAAHNQARELINHNDGYVFSVEDDTLFSPGSFKKLMNIAVSNRAFGLAGGVELGRWGVPYVGAWKADDIYEPTLLTSVDKKNSSYENIDAIGLYCTLIRADLYKQHNFTSSNGLGPDINLGIETRQLGFENFIHWGVPCTHLFQKNNVEKKLTPSDEARIIKLKKEGETKWRPIY